MQATPDATVTPPPPHGGALCQLIDNDKIAQLRDEAKGLLALELSLRQTCDVECLLNGAFSPLRGFLVRADYQSVLDNMRLTTGELWPMPITLDVSEDFAAKCKVGQRIALKEVNEGLRLAILTIEDIWTPDKEEEATKVFGANDEAHPSVKYLHRTAGAVYLGGKLEGIQLPPHYDFVELRKTPAELRDDFNKKNWNKVVAFQTRNPMHRSHKELTVRAAKSVKANLLIHPSVGMTKPGDVDHYTRVRCYKAMMAYYPEHMAMLSLLPLAMRMGGPREALWHAIIRKNYGATHFIVGRDHAGPGDNSQGRPFYDPYAAQDLVRQYADELGITMVPFQMVVYVEDTNDYRPMDEVPEGARVLNISGTELRRRLFEGIDIPDWFSFPAVIDLLRQSYPARNKRGFTLFFTGLSCSGKSTLANAVRTALLEIGSRTVSVLEGKKIRGLISSELSYTPEDRDLSIQRIGFVAEQITKAGGVAILAAIAPYAKAREAVRRSVSQYGGFVEIYLSTPLPVCEQRDRKGNYEKARQGSIPDFTGISDPYEPPENPEIVIDTSVVSVHQAVKQIVLYLETEGWINTNE